MEARIPILKQPPGELRDVGGYRLHVYGMGKGDEHAPVVVLESGLATGALIWGRVQPSVASFARVYTYDRAGYGWSDEARGQRSPELLVTALHTWLAEIPGPLILVGHSFGGLLVQLFAQRYPERVVGLVLLDAVSDQMFLRAPQAYLHWASRLRQTFRTLNLTARLGLLHVLTGFGLTHLLPEMVTKQPHEWQAGLLAGGFLSGKNFRAALAELPLFAANEHLVERDVSLGAVSLTVLTHGRSTMFGGLSPDESEQAEQVWQQFQQETASRSSQGRLIVAEKSGHDIHIDQPELVIEVIRQMVSSSLQKTRRYSQRTQPSQ